MGGAGWVSDGCGGVPGAGCVFCVGAVGWAGWVEKGGCPVKERSCEYGERKGWESG